MDRTGLGRCPCHPQGNEQVQHDGSLQFQGAGQGKYLRLQQLIRTLVPAHRTHLDLLLPGPSLHRPRLRIHPRKIRLLPVPARPAQYQALTRQLRGSQTH